VHITASIKDIMVAKQQTKISEVAKRSQSMVNNIETPHIQIVCAIEHISETNDTINAMELCYVQEPLERLLAKL